MRQKLVEVRIVAEVAALGELRGDVLQVGGCDAVREQGRLEPVERVEEIVPAAHRAATTLGRIALPLQRQERVDGRERRRRAGARGLRRRAFAAEDEAAARRGAALQCAGTERRRRLGVDAHGATVGRQG